MKKELSDPNKKRDYWERLSQKISSAGETKNKRPDTSDVEIDFLKNYCTKSSTVLDLGSGTGLITNKLLPLVESIVAVEKFKEFTKFIVDDPSMLVINSDLKGFQIRKEFDIVLCTGVAQCFPKNEMIDIYKNIFDMLDQDGYFISRMHCGINEDIIVDGYSEELQTDYFAEYRSLESEKETLYNTGFKSVEVFDFLPDTINVWENSRHFYFVCKK